MLHLTLTIISYPSSASIIAYIVCLLSHIESTIKSLLIEHSLVPQGGARLSR